jgi:hypothetical protein
MWMKQVRVRRDCGRAEGVTFFLFYFLVLIKDEEGGGESSNIERYSWRGSSTVSHGSIVEGRWSAKIRVICEQSDEGAQVL